jgi:hypothetical protein
MWALALTFGNAQTTETKEKIELLNASKEQIINQEKDALKLEVENINKRQESGNISQTEAEELKN